MTKDWPVKWQCLETKARFIHQVMRGETSVRAAEDLDSGALTYAEIKAIASGNPAVVEKIRIDTKNSVGINWTMRLARKLSMASFPGRCAAYPGPRSARPGLHLRG